MITEPAYCSLRCCQPKHEHSKSFYFACTHAINKTGVKTTIMLTNTLSGRVEMQTSVSGNRFIYCVRTSKIEALASSPLLLCSCFRLVTPQTAVRWLSYHWKELGKSVTSTGIQLKMKTNYHGSLQTGSIDETGNCFQTPFLTCSGVDDFFPRRKARDRQNGRPWISTLEWKLRLELSGDQDAALTSSSLGYYAVSVSDGILWSGMVGHTAVQWNLHL